MAMSVMSVLAVLAGLCLFAEVSAQTIKPCNGTVPSQPFVYNISKMNENICPLAGIQKDALLCIPRLLSLSIDYSITGVGGPKVCLIRNITTFCDEAGEGEFDGLLIVLNNFPMSGKLEISVGVLDIYYGNGSRPLHIMSGKNLSISGSLVIEERVFDQLGLTYVCEILDGQIIRSNLSTNLGSSDCLKPAVGSGRFDSGFAQSLTLLSPASSQPRIVTLFLTDDITCSSTAKKLSNEFTVNIVISSTGPTDPLPPQGTESGVIIGGVVGAVGFLLLLAIVVVVIIFCLVCRLRSPPRIDYESHTDGPTKYTVPTDLRVSAGNNTGHFTTRDSGVGYSPFAPRTPADDCTVIVAWDYNDPWYLILKEKLGTNFQSSVKELVLTENLKEFENHFNEKLFSPEVRHLLLIENVDEANHHSFYSSCLEKFIGSIESGACDELSKVWYTRLGSPEEFDTHTAINRLGITQSKASTTGEECAHAIHKTILSYDLLHPRADEGVGKTTSLGPHPNWDVKQENTSSLPEQRKILELLEVSAHNAEVAARYSAAAAKNTKAMRDNMSVVAETVGGTDETAKRTLILLEENIARQERENLGITEDEEPTES